MGSNYKTTADDYNAKYFCNEKGLTCEPLPFGDNGAFKIGIFKDDKLVKVREAIWDYKERQYATYETYRSLANKIFKDGNKQ